MLPLRFTWIAVAAALAVPVSAGARTWPGDYEGRLEALALLQTLNVELLSHDSATATLQWWCDDHAIAPGQKILARRVSEAETPAGPEERKVLGVGPTEPVGHRRVRLACGDHVLSEADNWYVPGRLTQEMNRLLEATQTPFGVAVKSLNFQRHTLSAVLLFQPLPAGWEARPRPAPAKAEVLEIPPQVIRHRAVLTTPDGTPFSLVEETYTAEVLAIPARP
jgi:chorismate-pyruvate lyase